MSSCSSEIDVIRTRISTCDDDNTVLYAYEPNTACVKDQGSVSDPSCPGEQQKIILNVLSHCQAIYDAVKNLDKKFDVINGKVSKIHRIRVKSLWQNRKPLGYSYKSYLLSKKFKFQKMKKKEHSPTKFSYPESYSPTIPVERPENDSQSNAIGSPYHSEGSPQQDQESFYQDDQDPSLNSPSSHSSILTRSYQSYYAPNDAPQGCSSMPCYSNPGAQSTSAIFSSAQASTAVPAAMLGQGIPTSAQNPEMMSYPSLLENTSLSYTASSSLCIPTGFRECETTHITTTTSLVGPDPSMLKQSCSGDPSAWSVEEVILFLKYVDPQILAQLADLFRQHDIDGKALLLLNSDMMMKYMGLKLGTAVKLCHYIEKLK